MKLVIVLFNLLLATMAQAAPMHIMLDPGHGGNDQGAVYGDIKESEIALKVGIELKRLLEGKKEFKVSMTRSTDLSLPLEERVNMAEKQEADIFLSLHANASKDIRAKGIEFYFQNHLAADEESLYLASVENKFYQQQMNPESSIQQSSELSKKGDVLAILEDLKRNTKMHRSHHLSQMLMQSLDKSQKKGSRVIRQAPFYVISKTRIPSVLVELGFISNPDEANKLQQTAYQKHLARQIFQGLQDYKEMVDKSELRSLH